MRREKRNLTIEKKIELARRYAGGDDVNALSNAYSVSVRQVYRVVAEQKGDTQYDEETHMMVGFSAAESEVDGFLEIARTVGVANGGYAQNRTLQTGAGGPKRTRHL